MDRSASVRELSDERLLQRLTALLRQQRGIEVELLAHLAEVDSRRLYLQHACSSMFCYCTDVLHMSDDAAYRRIHAARAARRYPVIFEMLRRGDLHLSGVSKLAPHLTRQNHAELLSQARHRTKRQIERLLAERFPKPDAPASMRRLPLPRSARGGGKKPAQHNAPTASHAGSSDGNAPTALSASTASLFASRPRDTSAQRASVTPLAPRRFKVQFTASDGLHDKIEQARDLLAHQIPDRDLAAVCERAFDALLSQLKRQKFALVPSPRPKATKRRRKPPQAVRADRQRVASEPRAESSSAHRERAAQPSGRAAGRASPATASRRSRHIPSAIKRAVVARDGLRCTFVDASGRRCRCTSQLEFHHETPYALGGEHTADNIRLLCRQHNDYMARRDYGDALVADRIAARRATPTPKDTVCPDSLDERHTEP